MRYSKRETPTQTIECNPPLSFNELLRTLFENGVVRGRHLPIISVVNVHGEPTIGPFGVVDRLSKDAVAFTRTNNSWNISSTASTCAVVAMDRVGGLRHGIQIVLDYDLDYAEIHAAWPARGYHDE